MAKILSGTSDGHSPMLMELPNFYVIGGQLYNKKGLTPVPGGVFTFPGVNTLTCHNGFLYGHSAGRANYETPFTALGRFYTTGKCRKWDRTLYADMGISKKERPAPYILDNVYTDYAYILGTGTALLDDVNTVATETTSSGGALTSTNKDANLLSICLYKINITTNEIVWKTTNTVMYPNSVLVKQDANYLYFMGTLQDTLLKEGTSYAYFTVNKQTGTITPELYLNTNSDYHTYRNYVGIETTSFCFLGAYKVYLGIIDNLFVYTYFIKHINYLRFIGLDDPVNNISPNKPFKHGYSNLSIHSHYGSMPSYVHNNSILSLYTHYIATCDGDSTNYNFYRCSYADTTTTAITTVTIYDSTGNKLEAPISPKLAEFPFDTANVCGIGQTYAFERDNGDGTYNTFLLTLTHISKTSYCLDDSAFPNYLVKLTTETTGTSATSNIGEISDTFYDVNYGHVWLDDFTFMTVGAKTIRVYKIDLDQEGVVMLNEYTVSHPSYEIAYAAIDTSNNIWYVERSMPDKEIYNVYFETSYIVSMIDIIFQDNNLNYTGADIATNIEVSAKNNLGELMESDVELELIGPAVFTSNNTNKLTVQTNTSANLVIPILVQGPGYINCKGTVIS